MQEKTMNLKSGNDAKVKVEKDKITIEIPNPKGLKLEELEAQPASICGGCTGILHAVGNVI